MAARALTAAGRRVAGQSQTRTTPLLASCRNGASMNHSTATARREEEPYKDVRAAAAAMTGAQVEAALNRKNVEVLQGEEEHVATVLPGEAIGDGALDGGEDASWVPDQDTGVFGPAHVDAHGGDAHPPVPSHLYGGATAATPGGAASVLDQAVFVREEDMEDVERPAAVDMANANADVNADGTPDAPSEAAAQRVRRRERGHRAEARAREATCVRSADGCSPGGAAAGALVVGLEGAAGGEQR